MKKGSRYLASLIKFLIPAGLFTGVGVALGRVFFDVAAAGAIIGLASYLFIVLVVMISDIVAINRELAAFRNGEDTEQAPASILTESFRDTTRA